MSDAATETQQGLMVCVLGHHEPDYPRNIAIQGALRRAGFAIALCHSRAPFPWRHLVLALRLFRAPRRARVVLVTEGGHRFVPWVRFMAQLTGRRVVFDPFLSRYNTRVEDRKLHRPGSLQARIAHFQDWSSTRAADHLLFDTHEHRDYFCARYHLRTPSTVVPVGVPEALFHPQTPANKPPGSATAVLFYGTYIPLQGVEFIVDASAKLRGTDIHITLIGDGQTREEMEARARVLGHGNLTFADPLPFDALPERLAACDISLGVFGTTDKAGRVVPNKVVQAAAMGCPIVTADTPAIRRYFEHGRSAYLVPAGDPAALGAALVELAGNAALRRRIGQGARQVFEMHFSEKALTQAVAAAVHKALDPTPTGAEMD